MAVLPARLHASIRRNEPLAAVPPTGEVRIPLALYEVDELRGCADLVMSRAEAQAVFTELAGALGYVNQAPALRRLEAVR